MTPTARMKERLLGRFYIKKKNAFLCFRDDIASNSTFTLEDSAICLTSEQSTVDVDIDRDNGSVLDVYLVRSFSISPFTLKEASNQLLFSPLVLPAVKSNLATSISSCQHTTITPPDGPNWLLNSTFQRCSSHFATSVANT